MKTTPKIAIITTTYNHSQYIGKTIESVINQTYVNWELFVGDDGSIDNTYEIALQYSKTDPRVHVWKNCPNLGIVGNMLSLLSRVDNSFDYVAFLEGDDIFVTTNIAEKVDIIKKYPDVMLVYSDISFINKNDDILSESVFRYRGVKLYQNASIPKDEFILHKMGPISSWSTCFVKKDILDVVGIHQIIDKKDAGDLHFYFQVATKYLVYGIDKPLTQYRRHPQNTSRPEGGITEHLQKQMQYYLQHNVISQEIYDKKLSWIYITYSVLDLEKGDKLAAWIHLKSSFGSSILSNIGHKAGVLLLLTMPLFMLSKLMNFIIKRG